MFKLIKWLFKDIKGRLNVLKWSLKALKMKVEGIKMKAKVKQNYRIVWTCTHIHRIWNGDNIKFEFRPGSMISMLEYFRQVAIQVCTAPPSSQLIICLAARSSLSLDIIPLVQSRVSIKRANLEYPDIF